MGRFRPRGSAGTQIWPARTDSASRNNPEKSVFGRVLCFRQKKKRGSSRKILPEDIGCAVHTSVLMVRNVTWHMLLLKCLLIFHRGVRVTHTQPKHRSPIALAQHTNCSTTTKNDTLPFVLPMVALARAASSACTSRTGAGGRADESCPLRVQQVRPP